jgi:glycosyl transferase, family 25
MMKNEYRIINFFDRTTILNLPERIDRRNETIEEFDMVAFNTEKVVFFPAIRCFDADGFPNVGVRGCFLSHLEVIKQAKRDNLNNILVMEDDIAFLPTIAQYEYEALKDLEQLDWDFAYFGHNLDISSQKIGWHKISDNMALAHFYAINGKIFDRFVKFIENILERPAGHPDGGPMHYDAAISTFRQKNPDINTYIFYPSLGFQRSSRTDLHSLKIWDRIQIIEPLIARMRKIKNKYRRLREKLKY